MFLFKCSCMLMFATHKQTYLCLIYMYMNKCIYIYCIYIYICVYTYIYTYIYIYNMYIYIYVQTHTCAHAVILFNICVLHKFLCWLCFSCDYPIFSWLLSVRWFPQEKWPNPGKRLPASTTIAWRKSTTSHSEDPCRAWCTTGW